MCFQRVALPNWSFEPTEEVTEPQLWSYVLKEHVKEEVPAHNTRTILLVVSKANIWIGKSLDIS
jgi:hypothetical protein